MNRVLQVFSLCIALTGCKKSDTSSPVPKPQPTITWTVSPIDLQRGDTAWYGDNKTVSYTTTNANSVVIPGVPGIGISGTFQTPQLTGLITYTATVSGEGGTIMSSKSIPVYSERRTFLCKDITWIMDSSTFWRVNSQGQQIDQTQQGVIDLNRYTFFPNNTGTGWSASTNTNHPFTWSFSNNDSRLETTGDVWDIELLTATKLVKTQIKPDPFNPSILFKSRVVYKKKI